MKLDETYLSTNEAAKLLGITRQRVIQLINQGRLKASKFAKVYVISHEDLKAVEDRAPGRPPKRTNRNKGAVNSQVMQSDQDSN